MPGTDQSSISTRILGDTNRGRDHDTLEFYYRVHGACHPDFVVLDLGAGRGGRLDNADDERIAKFLRIRGLVKHVVGADVDPIVHENRLVDETVQTAPGAPLPFPDHHFDLVFCDWVLEHIEDPQSFSREVDRLLKPGGRFLARTVSKWSNVAVSGRALAGLKMPLLRFLQVERQERDVFPAYYRLNTFADLARHFPADRWQDRSATLKPPTGYGAGIPGFRALLDLYQYLPTRATDTVLIADLQKHNQPDRSDKR